MPVPANMTAGNQLIERLPVADSRLLLAACRPVELEFGQVLAEAGAQSEQVLFPSTAIISLTAQVDEHHPLAIAMIGYEGMLGATLALGVTPHPMRAIVQRDGHALEISIADFQRQMQDSPALRRTVHAYLFVLLEQLSQTAGCNTFHEVPARLARWLLMMDDRARGERLALTHLFLAEMLGVRRSAVTIAAGQLQEKQLIRYARGQIQVLSRTGLAAVACECYPAALAAYDARLGLNLSS